MTQDVSRVQTSAGDWDHSWKKVGSWDPESKSFLAKIRKVEARLGKFIQKLGKLEVKPNFGWEIRKIEPN